MRPTFFAPLLVLGFASPARADYAPPPDDEHPSRHDHRDERYRYDPPEDEPRRYEPIADPDRPRSTARALVGPAARFAEGAQGGLALALDVGARPAGVRLGASWLGAGNDGGLSQYVAELWIDFDEDGTLHPILGAGGGIARLDAEDAATGDVVTRTAGIGVLRGTLQYRLPVRGVDARAALDLTGAVPAFRSREVSGDPWATATVMVGVGF